MPRHLYAKWFAAFLLVGVFFGLAINAAIGSLSPLQFDEEELPFVWHTDQPLATLLPLGLCFAIGLILPVAFTATQLPGVMRFAVVAAATGITLAAAVCCLLSLFIQTHIGSCLLWLLSYGFIAWRAWHAGESP